jgi:molybdate transport system ATP-binding protein
MISFCAKKLLQPAQGSMMLDVSFDLQKGGLAAIYGASGAGKTTLLRILAGLLHPDAGNIAIDGNTWLDTEKGINLAPQKRSVGLVFQDYALFPNMTIKGNLEYALAAGQDKKVISELAEVMELSRMMGRRPDTLSGGQKQRVALARALVRKPQLLLLDEPLSALDNDMRGKLQEYILKVHRHYGLTTILVSHDIQEIYRMAGNVFVLDQGKIVKQGAPGELFMNGGAGKFEMPGEVLGIERCDVIYMVSVLWYNRVIRIAATGDDAQYLKPGDTVVISSGLFNTVITRVGVK